jgi:hypothetical protein
MPQETDRLPAKRRRIQADQMTRGEAASDALGRHAKSEEPEFVDEPDLPAGEPSGAPTSNTKERLDLDKQQERPPSRKGQ